MDSLFASFSPFRPHVFVRSRRTPRAVTGLLSGLSLLLAGALFTPGLAHAGPRDDMKVAYDRALADANNLEYDSALSGLNGAIAAAESQGHQADPVLASLYMLRAALTFSAEGRGAKDRILADLQRAVSLNYYVVVPMEMRSDELAGYMQDARRASGATAPQPITLTDPVESCGEDLHFEVLLSVPDGGTAALYWRRASSTGEFEGAEMPAFSNVAEVEISASEHGDESIEYFIYAFDASNNPVANLGLQEQPLVIEQRCAAAAIAPTDGDKDPDVAAAPKEPSSLPRVWINLGLGTGFGLASGQAENTYRQFFPRGSQVYGPAESGCAIARWVAGTRDVKTLTAPELSMAFDAYGAPGTQQQMIQAYDPDACAERHPVSTGFALAPFHIEPEVSFRVGKRVSIGVYSRLQLVTGSSVYRDDPKKDLQTSFTEDIRSPDPQGIRQASRFTWAVGAKFKYFLGKEGKKLRPFIGGFAGGGSARLRVDMGFANDRNGNSVPDNVEIGRDNGLTGSPCYPVWPYNGACGDDLAGGDNALAQQVAQNADSTSRVDTVRIGPVFFGALVGFNYQIAKHFAVFGEAHIGGWLPSQASMLIDLSIGPALTF